MLNQINWTLESDQIIKFLYVDQQIFNWEVISAELNFRLNMQTNSTQCRNRYVEKYGIVQRDQWTSDQEKELYRLHNQNGNKWAFICQNLLGRNDNCVKNHFYSKLRKSLRTINKIAKLYLKKQVKQVSDLVLYKLTEVTDQSLKPDTEVSNKIIEMSYEIKNKLLCYQMDQKDINNNLDYKYQRQLLQELGQFNKIYKKKPKKQKASNLGDQNLKKYKKRQKGNQLNQIKKQQFGSNIQFVSQSFPYSYRKYDDKKKVLRSKKNNQNLKDQQKNIEMQYPRKISQFFSLSQNNMGQSGFHIFNQYEQSQQQRPKKTINFLIKAPSQLQKLANQQYSIPFIHHQTNDRVNNQPILHIPSSNQKPKLKVQDILKAEGILQNGDYRSQNQNYFRRSNSQRSFSICFQSSNPPDMFGEGVVFLNDFKQLSEMENSSQLFPGQQIQ